MHQYHSPVCVYHDDEDKWTFKVQKFVLHGFIFSQELLTYFSTSVKLLGVTRDYVKFNNVRKTLMLLLPDFYSNKY